MAKLIIFDVIIWLYTVVTEEEHDSREEEEEVRGDVRSKDSSTMLEAVLLLLSQLRGDQLKTVKVKVQ